KSRTGLLVGVIATLLLVVIVGTLAAVLLLKPGGGTTAIATATATPTLAPTATPVVIYQNTLLGSQPDWPTDSTCSGKSDGYHIKSSRESSFLCAPDLASQSDMNIAVTLKQISGDESIYAGIALRRPSQGNSYVFGVNADGRWVFGKFTSGTFSIIAGDAASTAVQRNLNAINTLQVTAKEAHFTFFVNGIQVGQADDSSYSTGKIGLLIGGAIEAVFTNLAITGV